MFSKNPVYTQPYIKAGFLFWSPPNAVQKIDAREISYMYCFYSLRCVAKYMTDISNHKLSIYPSIWPL